MPFQDKNKVVIAVAGSGKTTSLVEEALANHEKRILFLTYTNENFDNIKRVFIEKNASLPENVEIKTWFSFLLKDGVRPYHNSVSGGARVTSVHFVEGSSGSNPRLRFLREADTENFYFDEKRRIYTDKISQYVCKCNDRSGGSVIKRLEEMYDTIYIDEFQDLAGWDLDVIQLLFESIMNITLVGDPRQVTYSTNHAKKNIQYRNEKITVFFRELEDRNLCKITNMSVCHRCNQEICDLADAVYPGLPKSTSSHTTAVDHAGVFQVTAEELGDYIAAYNPVILRYKSNSNTLGMPARNFGTAKGLTFERVLIFPTSDMKTFFQTRDISGVADGTKAKLYVAITRARHSVTFVL